MKLKTKYILPLILVVAAIIRLYAIGRGDPLTDEVLYAFRAIGYLDFDFALYQPTTLQLFHTAIPWWVKLSFHDHPPLVFLFQYIAMLFFGRTLIVVRALSALCGAASVALVYGIGKKLRDERTGLVAAAIMAVTVFMVYISRIGLQESQVIMFMLLMVFCYLKSRENQKWFLASGAALGLALLSKYTAAVMVIPIVVDVAFFSRAALRNKFFWGGVGFTVLLFSPVIVYNALLYQTFQHFDFQLSYIFGQHVPQWVVTPGKDIGSLADRAIGFVTNMWVYGSRVFMVVGVASILYCVMSLWKKIKKPLARSLVFILSALIAHRVLFLAVGPGVRFLTMIIPWVVLAIAFMVADFLASNKSWLRETSVVALVVFIVAELLFSINTYVAYSPIGIEGITYSHLHEDMRDWGYNELDTYLGTIVTGKYPSLTVPFDYAFVEDVRAKGIEQARADGATPTAYLFVYDDNMHDLAALWVLQRRALYDGWAVIPASVYEETIAEKGSGYYRLGGFTAIYFIRATDQILLVKPERRVNDGEKLEGELVDKKVSPMSIKNGAGIEMFRVYQF